MSRCRCADISNYTSQKPHYEWLSSTSGAKTSKADTCFERICLFVDTIANASSAGASTSFSAPKANEVRAEYSALSSAAASQLSSLDAKIDQLRQEDSRYHQELKERQEQQRKQQEQQKQQKQTKHR